MSLKQINQDTKSSLLVGRTESGVMLKDSSQDSKANWLFRRFRKSNVPQNKSNRRPDSITSKLDQFVKVEIAPKTSRQDSNSCSGGGTEKDATHGMYQPRPEEESVHIRSSKGSLTPGGKSIRDGPSLGLGVHAPILGVSAALALATLGITIAYSGAGQVSQISSQSEVCIDDVGTNWPIPETRHLYKQLERRTLNGVPQVCATTQAQLTALMELAMSPMKDKSEMNAPLENSQTFTPVSAHKLLQAPDTDINIIEQTVARQKNWALNLDDNNSHIEHSIGVVVTNDSLVIEFPGIYYVYIGVSFQLISARSQREFEFQEWILYVYKERGNRPHLSSILFQVAHPDCDNCPSIETTLFAGGSFYLEAGDHIQVVYGNLHVVKFNTESTFFGLMMIDTGEPKYFGF